MTPGARGGLPEWWEAVSPRKRFLFLVLVGLALFFWGYRVIYLPQTARLKKARMEWNTFRQQVAAATTGLLDVKKERLELQELAEQTELREKELMSVERTLITSANMGELLGKLTEQQEGLQMTLESIEQKAKQGALLPEVAIKVGFAASWADLVTYLRRVERISPFLRIAQMEVSESKGEGNSGALARLILETPVRFSSEPGGLEASSSLPSVGKASFLRNPFAFSGQDPAQQKKIKALKVTGITWRGESSTAIINEQVVRVGDWLDQMFVKQILSNVVILSDGAETYTLTLDQQ